MSEFWDARAFLLSFLIALTLLWLVFLPVVLATIFKKGEK